MSLPDYLRSGVEKILRPGDRPNRLLRAGLLVLVLAVSLEEVRYLVLVFPWGADLEIPLRAADRWLNGGQPYLASAFALQTGYGLPFLYPPYVLPLYALLLPLPRVLLHVAWLLAGLVLAWKACSELQVPRRWIPLLLLWPPFAEGLIVGNPQIAIFAGYVLLLHSRRPGLVDQAPGWHPARSPALRRGLLGAATVFVKVAQPHPLVYLARWERRTAVVAVGAIAILFVVSLPLIGLPLWGEWLAQLRRAADPTWTVGGLTLATILPAPMPALVIVACLLGVALVPRRRTEWVGVLIVLGSPALHAFSLLFLLPALLRLRREISLVAAVLVAASSWWLALGITAGALALAEFVPALLEPRPSDPVERADFARAPSGGP